MAYGKKELIEDISDVRRLAGLAEAPKKANPQAVSAPGSFGIGKIQGSDYQSKGGQLVDPGTGKINWGDPDSAADFFRADKIRQAQQEPTPAPKAAAPKPAAPKPAAPKATAPKPAAPAAKDSGVSPPYPTAAYDLPDKPTPPEKALGYPQGYPPQAQTFTGKPYNPPQIKGVNDAPVIPPAGVSRMAPPNFAPTPAPANTITKPPLPLSSFTDKKPYEDPRLISMQGPRGSDVDTIAKPSSETDPGTGNIVPSTSLANPQSPEKKIQPWNRITPAPMPIITTPPTQKTSSLDISNLDTADKNPQTNKPTVSEADPPKDYSRYGRYAGAAQAVDQERAIDQDYPGDSNRIKWQGDIDKYRSGVKSGNIQAPPPAALPTPNPQYDPNAAAAAQARIDQRRADKLGKQGLAPNPDYDDWKIANQPQYGTLKPDPFGSSPPPDKFIRKDQGQKTQNIPSNLFFDPDAVDNPKESTLNKKPLSMEDIVAELRQMAELDESTAMDRVSARVAGRSTATEGEDDYEDNETQFEREFMGMLDGSEEDEEVDECGCGDDMSDGSMSPMSNMGQKEPETTQIAVMPVDALKQILKMAGM